jgi:lipopolysaccharide/colanic/teichoic acid biosynthesis glycosyltransferase
MLVEGDIRSKPETLHHADPGEREGRPAEPSCTSRYARIKTVLDFAAAACLFVLALPVIVVAAVLVRLTSRGPALYSQTRLGRLGRPYAIYKIRTMVHDCERTSGVRWATARDPRVTPLGRILRRTHVDELPQLWNVLRGDMSLIGPRPERPEFVPQLERAIPHYRDRLLVRPGLSGLAQVQLPPDSDLDSVRRKLAYDLYYVRRVSFALDVRIMLSTMSYLMGIPVHVSRRLFQVPGGEVVERAYEALPQPVGQAAQLQPA